MWNGTIFVDLDWPLNASSLLSAQLSFLFDFIHPIRRKKIIELNRYYHLQIPAEDLKTSASWSQVDAPRQYHWYCVKIQMAKKVFVDKQMFFLLVNESGAKEMKLEVCALCGDADPRRVCRELHFVWRAVLEDLTWNTSVMGGRTLVFSDWNAAGAPAAMQHSFLL